MSIAGNALVMYLEYPGVNKKMPIVHYPETLVILKMTSRLAILKFVP